MCLFPHTPLVIHPSSSPTTSSSQNPSARPAFPCSSPPYATPPAGCGRKAPPVRAQSSRRAPVVVWKSCCCSRVLVRDRRTHTPHHPHYRRRRPTDRPTCEAGVGDGGGAREGAPAVRAHVQHVAGAGVEGALFWVWGVGIDFFGVDWDGWASELESIVSNRSIDRSMDQPTIRIDRSIHQSMSTVSPNPPPPPAFPCTHRR